MLSLYLGFDWTALRNPDDYFDNVRKRSWFNEDIVKQIVKDIDNSVLMSEYLLINPVFGDMSTKSISGGAKTLILLLKGHDETLIDLSACGENCTSWLAKISTMVDCKATLSGNHIVFPEGMNFDIYVENCKERVNTRKQWLEMLAKYLYHDIEERNREKRFNMG